MYSGFITARHTANWLGAHQKFNRVAYRQLAPYVNMPKFPALDRIQHFEGYRGPDGVKTKTTHRHEEPSHFYDPVNDSGPLLEHIENHHASLIIALQEQNKVRAAFEAAWLAHTVVDGLTPAHHYPYKEELHEMYIESNQQINKPRHKVVLQGANRRKMIKNNWDMLGAKGLLSTHIHFELGVAAAVITNKFPDRLNQQKLNHARTLGSVNFFKEQAMEVYKLNLYEKFYKTSWTVGLARTVRRQLAPAIIQAVAIEWVLAAEEAGIDRRDLR